MREETVYRYIHITKTRCGKCKHLHKHYYLKRHYEYMCHARGQELPFNPPNFFADACEDFEEKENV